MSSNHPWKNIQFKNKVRKTIIGSPCKNCNSRVKYPNKKKKDSDEWYYTCYSCFNAAQRKYREKINGNTKEKVKEKQNVRRRIEEHQHRKEQDLDYDYPMDID